LPHRAFVRASLAAGVRDSTETRPEGIRLALKDWLTGVGLLTHRDDPKESERQGMDSDCNPW